MKILCTASVGSHIDTVHAIERALRNIYPNLEIVICDVPDFKSSRWNAFKVPYQGLGKRITFDFTYCGITDREVHSKNWNLIQNAALNILNEIKPNIFITILDCLYGEYALLKATKILKIPSLMIQEGPFRPPTITNKKQMTLISVRKSIMHLLNLKYKPLLPNYGNGGTDKFAVSSEYYAHLFLKSGVSVNKINVTGIPRYDKLLEHRKLYRSKRHERCNSKSMSKILLLTQPFFAYELCTKSENDKIYTKVVEGLKKLKSDRDFELDIKLHPSDLDDSIEAFQREKLYCNLKNIIHSDTPLPEILYKYDLVIGFYSGGLLEALALNIPVISFRINKFENKYRWFNQAKVLSAKTDDELHQACKVALKNNHVCADRKLLEDEIGIIDGQASNRVAQLCKILYENSKHKFA